MVNRSAKQYAAAEPKLAAGEDEEVDHLAGVKDNRTRRRRCVAAWCCGALGVGVVAAGLAVGLTRPWDTAAASGADGPAPSSSPVALAMRGVEFAMATRLTGAAASEFAPGSAAIGAWERATARELAVPSSQCNCAANDASARRLVRARRAQASGVDVVCTLRLRHDEEVRRVMNATGFAPEAFRDASAGFVKVNTTSMAAFTEHLSSTIASTASTGLARRVFEEFRVEALAVPAATRPDTSSMVVEPALSRMAVPPRPVAGTTPTPSTTASATPTASVTPTSSVTPTPSSSVTPSSTVTPSASSSVTPTASVTPSSSVTPSASSSVTPTASVTSSPSASVTPSSSVTPAASVTPTSSVTPSASSSATPTASVTPSPSASSSPSSSVTPSPSPSASVTPSATGTPSPSMAPSPSATGTPSPPPSYTYVVGADTPGVTCTTICSDAGKTCSDAGTEDIASSTTKCKDAWLATGGRNSGFGAPGGSGGCVAKNQLNSHANYGGAANCAAVASGGSSSYYDSVGRICACL